MNRRTKTIVASVAGVALTLGIVGTVVVLNSNDEPEPSPVAMAGALNVTEQQLWGTVMQLPDNYTAFFIGNGLEAVSDGERVPAADLTLETEDGPGLYSEEQIAQIGQQLADAPPSSVLFVDDRSVDEIGLTTALSTVTPSNGLSLGDSNEAITAFMQTQFADQEGTYSNLGIPWVPNASFSFTQGSEEDEVQWQVTEHLLQFGDAMVSVRFTTEGEHAAEFTTEFNNFLSTWTRG